MQSKVGVKAIIVSRPFKTLYYETLADLCPELESAPAGRLRCQR